MNPPFTQKEWDLAYQAWLKNYPYFEFDRQVRPFLDFTVPRTDWIRMTRQASLRSAATVAEKMGIARQTYDAIEKSEPTGKITLAALKTVAEALDCDLIYGFRPRSGETHARTIWKTLYRAAQSHPWVSRSTLGQRYRAVVKIAAQLQRNPEFRKSQGWMKRLP